MVDAYSHGAILAARQNVAVGSHNATIRLHMVLTPMLDTGNTFSQWTRERSSGMTLPRAWQMINPEQEGGDICAGKDCESVL